MDSTSETKPSSTLRTSTLRAMRWMAFGQAAAVLLQIPYTVVMARLLTPAEFGIVGLASVLLRFVTYFAQLGIQTALVQAPTVSDRQYQASQGLSLMGGGLGAVAVAACAGPASAFMEEPALQAVIVVLALDMPITAIGVAATARLRRQLRFRALATVETCAFALGFLGVGTTTATLGSGYWSLVAATLCASALRSVGCLLAARMTFSPRWRPRDIGAITRFGWKVSAVYFLEYWSGSADTFMVGRNLTSTELGYYTRGSLLIWLPIQQIGVVISRVLLTSLRSVSSVTVGTSLNSGLRVLSGILLPLVSIVVSAAPVAVFLVLGGQWGPVAGLLPLMGGAALLNTLSQLPAVALEAHGHLMEKLMAQAVQVAVMAIGLAAVTYVGLGLAYYAGVWLCGELSRHVLYLLACRRRFAISLKSTSQGYLFSAICSAPACLVAGLAARGELPFGASILGVFTSAVVFLLVLMSNRNWPLRQGIRQLGLLDEYFARASKGARLLYRIAS